MCVVLGDERGSQNARVPVYERICAFGFAARLRQVSPAQCVTRAGGGGPEDKEGPDNGVWDVLNHGDRGGIGLNNYQQPGVPHAHLLNNTCIHPWL